MKQTILLQPVISEKSMTIAQNGWFTFLVDRGSSKPVIKEAVEKQFKVNVTSVRTLVMKGTTLRTGKKRLIANGANWKKAIVTLKKDQKIDLFDIGTNKNR